MGILSVERTQILSWLGIARPGRVTQHNRLAIFIKPKDKTNSRIYSVKQNAKKKVKVKVGENDKIIRNGSIPQKIMVLP